MQIKKTFAPYVAPNTEIVEFVGQTVFATSFNGTGIDDSPVDDGLDL